MTTDAIPTNTEAPHNTDTNKSLHYQLADYITTIRDVGIKSFDA